MCRYHITRGFTDAEYRSIWLEYQLYDMREKEEARKIGAEIGNALGGGS